MGDGSVLLAEEGIAQLPLVQCMVTPRFSAAEASAIQAPAWVLKVMPRFTSISPGRLAILRSFSTILFGLKLHQWGERGDTKRVTDITKSGIRQRGW